MKLKMWLSCIVLVTVVLWGCNNPQTTIISESSISDSLAQNSISNVDTDMVNLFFAKAWNVSYPAEHFVRGYIEIENAGYYKEVFVRFQEKDSGVWNEVPATFYKMFYGNKEIWQFDLPEMEMEFAIGYRVNGNEYWDNNGGWNYGINSGGNGKLTYPEFAFGRSIVCLDFAQIWENRDGSYSMGGFIYATEVSSDRLVEIIYTTDNWQTTLSSECFIKVLSHNDESVYKIRIDFDQLPETVEFTIKYHGDGYTAWDNKFLDNYRLSGIDFVQ